MFKQICFAMTFAGAASAEEAPSVVWGAQVYAEVCADCHGADALGDHGPDIRGRSEFEVKMAIRGFDEMPQIDLTPEERRSVVLYLDTLN